MKPIAWLGILLIVLGAPALAWEKVLDAGPIHAAAEKQDHVSMPPILGALHGRAESRCLSSEPEKRLSPTHHQCPPESRATHGPLVK